MRDRHRLPTLSFFLIALLLLPTPGSAAPESPVYAAGGESFATWRDYYTSTYFQQNGKRCGKPKSVPPLFVAPSDCTFTFTNPSSDYDTVDIYEIPIVVHIIEHTNGNGQISDAVVHSQIDILNEDFRALAGTPGAPGYDVGVRFALATTDPAGNPTTGITRTVNNSWFADADGYWNTLAWDTSRYMNIYTNEASGNLGYVPNLPQAGLAGDPADRVVVLWSAFGRNSSGGPPFDQGRTATHEVGHYLGLEHTFNGGCAGATPPTCYSTGDLICDTNSVSSPNFDCPAAPVSCGSPDPNENYMDYSDDTCMDRFTEEQSHRMRCSLLNYRSDLYSIYNPGVCGNDIVESGEQCDGTDPGSCPTGVCDPDCTCEDPVCGNDITEPGEECDGTDDTACPGECSGSCECPTACGNGVCDAGETASTCGADCGCGAGCGGEAPDGCYCDASCVTFGDCCPDACAECGVSCPLLPTCGATPTTPCRDTARLGASLTIKDDGNDAKDKLVFKIRRGDATQTSDFLGPLSAGKIGSLCLYDGSAATQPILAAAVATGGTCAGKDCWKATSTKGFKYTDKSATPDGITKLKLKEGADGKAQVQATAMGSQLDTPAPPLQFPLTMQFLMDDGVTTNCWQSTFTTPLRNEPGRLRTKGP